MTPQEEEEEEVEEGMVTMMAMAATLASASLWTCLCCLPAVEEACPWAWPARAGGCDRGYSLTPSVVAPWSWACE